MPNKNLFTLPILLALATVSYASFNTFRPVARSAQPQVQGAYQKATFLPEPIGAQKLGQTKTTKNESATLRTTQNLEKIKNFYKIALADAGWKIDDETNTDSFYEAHYQKNEDKLTIAAIQEEEGTTIVTTELKYHQ